jgi:hypothetical protein
MGGCAVLLRLVVMLATWLVNVFDQVTRSVLTSVSDEVDDVFSLKEKLLSLVIEE